MGPDKIREDYLIRKKEQSAAIITSIERTRKKAE